MKHFSIFSSHSFLTVDLGWEGRGCWEDWRCAHLGEVCYCPQLSWRSVCWGPGSCSLLPSWDASRPGARRWPLKPSTAFTWKETVFGPLLFEWTRNKLTFRDNLVKYATHIYRTLIILGLFLIHKYLCLRCSVLRTFQDKWDRIPPPWTHSIFLTSDSLLCSLQ